MSVEETLIEVVADEQHKIWAHWMKYLFSVCSETDDGSMLIPKEKVDRWQRQMWTPYADLTDAEQESDRHQALKVLPALNNIMLALTDATERAEQAEAALAELRTEFALAQVALASANVTYTVNRGVGEALAMAEAEQAVNDYPNSAEPECEKCGLLMEWEGCWSCSGDGEHSLHEEDPLLYDEDDSERCDVCDGDGGWWWCPSCAKRNATIEVQP